MIKMFSKKWWVYLVTISIGVGSIAYACGDYGYWEDYEDYYSNIQKEKYIDTALIPFFYRASDLFQSDEINNYNDKFNVENTADWAKYFNNAIPADLLDSLLHTKGNSERYTYFSNTFGKYARQDEKKATKFLEFLALAKRIENYSTDEYDYWYYDDKKKKEKASAAIVAQAEEAYNKEKKDDFIKNRLWFQAMKANFYSANPQNAIAFFNKTEAKQPKNYLYYRALGYVAGANYKQGNYALSNYQYAQIFQHEPKLRGIAIYNFNPQSEADFAASLALTQNKEEQIALWTILGMYADEFRAIKEIYKLDPKQKNLELLAASYLNRFEVNFTSTEFNTIKDYKANLKARIDNDELKFVKEVAASKQNSAPALWFNIAGFMAMMNGEYDYAQTAFSNSFNVTNKSQDFKDQLRILNYVNDVLRLNTISSADEKALLSEYKWVLSHVKSDRWGYASSNYVGKNNFIPSYRFSKRYLSKLYAEKGNTVMQQVFADNTAYYYDKFNQKNMLDLINSASKTDWQKAALADYPYRKEDIYYLQGLNALYNGDLQSAMQLIRKCQGSDYIVTLSGNPFNGKIKDCNDCDHAAKQSKKYNSVSVLETMMEMKQNIEKGDDVFNNANLLGNAYYNLSYYGNGRLLYASNSLIEASDMYISEQYADMLLDMSQAKKYYTIALNAATNDEQRAKMHYLLAKVERNSYYQKMYTKPNQDFSGYDYWYNDSDIDFKAWDNFKTLRAKYAHTKYYKDVINECGYFKTYVKKAR